VRQAALIQPLVACPGWLSNPTLILCIAGVVLPNALSLGALLTGIGAPPRPAAIVAYATIAVIARIAPPFVTIGLYLATAAYDAISTIALLFNLAPSEIGVALHLSAELKLFASPFYAALSIALAVLVGVNIAVLTLKRQVLRRGNPVVMMGVACAFAAVDFVTNVSAHYQFGTLYSAGKPMESAAAASGFRSAALAGSGRHVLVVMVEALGHFADPAHQALLLQPFRDRTLLERYSVTTGSTTYYGSTTAAEMRELCNTREPYQALLEGRQLTCLPEQMASLGYRTMSLHNFTSAFFGRDHWYPKLGFEKRLFAPDLAGTVHRLCGGPFRGPCDVDVVPFVARQLREAGKPTLFYWITLSTHVPIAPGEGTPRLGCDRGGGRIGHTEVCHMTEMWLDLWESLAQLAVEIPDTDILLVGDHAPPLWSKTGRALFTPGQATWVRLTPRGHQARASRAP
jgi:hypothetical protein